jgi:two-component system, OmpR family, response regulator BaeR
MTFARHPHSASAAHILVVEDDAKIADMLINYLQAQGYVTSHCTNGLQVADTVRNTSPDLVLLDVMLPGLNGVSVCQDIRQFSNVPLIMITARVDEIDRLLGLDVGADDYICKPFSPREVVARIKALLRRTHMAANSAAHPDKAIETSPARLSYNDHPHSTVMAPMPTSPLHLCQQRQQALWNDQALPLTSVEFRLMCALYAKHGEVLTRAKLLDHVHSEWRDVSDRTIDSHIKNLRRKLVQAGATVVAIHSVYGVGYRLELESTKLAPSAIRQLDSSTS